MVKMKIVAGLGSIDDYEVYKEAGADELFCGFMPHEYVRLFGRNNPLNRREVIYYNVSAGSESEMMILALKMKHYGVPVSIALNGLFFQEEQYEYIELLVDKCKSWGFKNFIVADNKLIEVLKTKEGINLEISGEYGELNSSLVDRLDGENVSRIIFPRQTTVEEMKSLVISGRAGTEFEAFVLNEKCHYTGAYCNSLHCDELCHICKMPYKLTGGKNQGEYETSDYIDEISGEDTTDIIGLTGCGICKLWKLRDAGITHLKIVSRGNSTEETVKDIASLKKALNILELSEKEEEYIKKVKAELFPKGCSHNCY